MSRMHLLCVLFVYGAALHVNRPNPQSRKGQRQAETNSVCGSALASLDEACWGEPTNQNTQEAKIIWMYWGGKQKDPDFLRFAIKSYRYHNPDYEIRVLNESTREFYLPWRKIQHKLTVKLTRKAEANILRTYLLAKHGGIWADASSFALNPFDEVIPYWGDTGGYFVPKVPCADRSMDNWFMWSRPREETFVKWLAYTKEYLFKPRKAPITNKPMHIESDRVHPDSLESLNLSSKLMGNTSDGGLLASMGELGQWPYHWQKYLFMQVLHDDARLQAKFDGCCFRVRLSACFYSDDPEEMNPERCVMTKYSKTQFKFVYEKLRQTGTQPWIE